jgi:SRSO17 transposase
VRAVVAEALGDAEHGVLIVDETGFIKKGTKSAGVARQYSGTAGRTRIPKWECSPRMHLLKGEG